MPTTKITSLSNPVILVVASYDSLSIFPTSSLGTQQYLSGLITLMTIGKNIAEIFEINSNSM
jgi:hypothetical protein